MSSGLGSNGQVSRCFYFFQDFTDCMVSSERFGVLSLFLSFLSYFSPQQKDSAPLANCGVLRDDYLECLHNQRVHHRKTLIAHEEAKQANGGGKGGHGGGGHH